MQRFRGLADLTFFPVGDMQTIHHQSSIQNKTAIDAFFICADQWWIKVCFSHIFLHLTYAQQLPKVEN